MRQTLSSRFSISPGINLWEVQRFSQAFQNSPVTTVLISRDTTLALVKTRDSVFRIMHCKNMGIKK